MDEEVLTPEMSFYFVVRGASVGRHVRINDAVVLHKKPNEGRVFVDVVSLDDWIMLGTNRLEIDWAPNAGDGGAKGEALLAAKSGEDVQVIHKWISLSDVPAVVEFSVGPPLEAAPESAPVLSAEDENVIREIVIALHAAISEKRIGDAAIVLRSRLPWLAQRLGIDSEEAEQRQLDALEMFTDEDVQLAPLSAASIDLVPACRGRLIRAEVQGRSPIRATLVGGSDGNLEMARLTFEKQGGAWVVAR